MIAREGGGTGTLFVVATPIGNLEDITLRALKILEAADLIAAEDTRRTRKLLSRHGITGKKLESYHDHNKEARTPSLLQRLNRGIIVALVTDSGTPGISDPGYYLVKRAVETGLTVVPIPGPSAVTAALSCGGLPTDRFAFEGFLPVKSGRRLRQLENLKMESRTVVLYESPHRIKKLLHELQETVGDRQIVVIREMTKIYEEKIHGTPEEVAEKLTEKKPKGEFVVLIAPQRTKSQP